MNQFVNRLSDQMTEEILEIISTSYKKISATSYQFTTADGINAMLKNKGETLVLAAGTQAPYDLDMLIFVNDWNKVHLLSKCYLESSYEGAGIIVQSVYIFENCAVDFEHVGCFFGRFVPILKMFFEALNEFAVSSR
jgi:hypothetical protein